jgi:hypothetical protein
MKYLLSFNWKNFLQRTALFFAVFIIIRLLVDVFENTVSFSRLLNQSFIRYLLFAMVLGLLDSETWRTKQTGNEKEEAVTFKSISAAVFHYAGVAFFISLLCAVIITIISLLRWLINLALSKKGIEIFPEFGKFLLVSAAIGICFACYDAFRNYRKLQQKEQ